MKKKKIVYEEMLWNIIWKDVKVFTLAIVFIGGIILVFSLFSHVAWCYATGDTCPSLQIPDPLYPSQK